MKPQWKSSGLEIPPKNNSHQKGSSGEDLYTYVGTHPNLAGKPRLRDGGFVNL